MNYQDGPVLVSKWFQYSYGQLQLKDKAVIGNIMNYFPLFCYFLKMNLPYRIDDQYVEKIN